VHLDELLNRRLELRTDCAVAALAAQNGDKNPLFGIRAIAEACDDVARCQSAFSPACRLFGETAGDHEDA